MTISEELKQQAIECGLCKQWQAEWGTPTTKDLCDKFIRGIDFCIKHNYPSIDYMDKHFKGKVEQYGIYINEEAISQGQSDIIANGNSKIDVYAPAVCDIYVRHNSHIRLRVPRNGFVYVSMFDNCTLEVVEKGENAEICVSLYGGEIINGKLVTRVYNKQLKQ